PIKDINLFRQYYKIIKKENPTAVLSYTIKPNTYGGIVCRMLKIPFFPNITGLGTAVENKSSLQALLINLYKVAFKKATCIFFQNKENMEFFNNRKIGSSNYELLPGSGVNLKEYPILKYPEEDVQINFLFISRIMREKGIDIYLEAAQSIKATHPNTTFHILGFCEDNAYLSKISELES